MTGRYQSKGDNAPVGFRAPAGGTVTQATNKGTAVTLNKRCGQITTDDASLGAGAEVTFTVNNEFVTAEDVPIVAIQSGGTSGEYAANVTAVGDGSFDITLTNRTAGSLSDAVVINFAIFSAVAE